MKKQTKKRSPYLDIIKAILIILVIIGHSIQYGSGSTYLEKQLFFNNYLFKFIYSFHMPLFIMISGYLSYNSLNKNSLKETFISKFKSFNISVLNTFLKRNKCPEEDIGKGSVNPCKIPNKI